jgi:hypothetical protein
VGVAINIVGMPLANGSAMVDFCFVIHADLQSRARFVLTHKTNFGNEKYVQHKHKSYFVFVLHKHKLNFGNAPIMTHLLEKTKKTHKDHQQLPICNNTIGVARNY